MISKNSNLVKEMKERLIMSNIDLHMHSFYSDDGEFKLQKLVDLCLVIRSLL